MSAKPHNGGGVCCGRRHAEAGGARGPSSRQLHGSGGDGRRSGGVWRRAGGGADGTCGLRVSAWEGKGGPSPEKQ
jgi:hypothetical protein